MEVYREAFPLRNNDWVLRFHAPKVMYYGDTQEKSSDQERPSHINTFPPVPYELPQYVQDVTRTTNYLWNPFSQFRDVCVEFATIHHLVYHVEGSQLSYAHGKGRLGPQGLCVSEPIYDGDFAEGFRHGQGRALIYIPVNGSPRLDGTYEGAWALNKRWGFGIMSYSSGEVYSGEWKDDFKHGLGMETFPDGSVYYGFFAFGERHGCGVFKWTAGEEDREYQSGGLVCRVPVSKTKDRKVPDFVKKVQDMCKDKKAPERPKVDAPLSSQGSSEPEGSPLLTRQVLSQFTPDGAVKLKLKKSLGAFMETGVSRLADRAATITGHSISVEVNKQSFVESAKGGNAITSLTFNNGTYTFAPVFASLQKICAEDIGKETIPQILSKIVIYQSEQERVECKDKVLSLYCNCSLAHVPDAEQVTSALESAE